MTVTSTPVWHDIFRRVTLKPDNITLEAETHQDTLNIVRGPGVNFGAANIGSDTFEINVDYDISVPVATTNISLEDVNGNLSEITFTPGRGVAINRISAQELEFESFSVTETDTLHTVTSRNNITSNKIFINNIEVGTINSNSSEDGFTGYDPGYNLIGNGTLDNPMRFSPLYQDSTTANNTDQFEFIAVGPGTLAYAANYVFNLAATTGSITLEREDPSSPGSWTTLDTQSGNTAGISYFIDGIYSELYSGSVTYRLTFAWTGNTGTITRYTNNTFEGGTYSPVTVPQLKTDTDGKTVDINDIQFFQNTIRTLVSNTDIVIDPAGSGQLRVLGNITADTLYGSVIGNLTGNVSGNLTGNVSGNLTGNVSGNLTGDLTGSVFADDSTLLVDGVDGKIVGDVETARLRTAETKIALGLTAGATSQGAQAVAVGNQAGQTSQGNTAVAIGSEAGKSLQGAQAVAIGYQTASVNQGGNAIAIGQNAGLTNQGVHAVAIGTDAGKTLQGNNSIIINATGTILNQPTANTFTVKPIRNAIGDYFLQYDPGTGEITYSSGIDGDITGSVFADDSTLLVDGIAGQIVGPINSSDGSNSITMDLINGVIIGGTGGAQIIGAAGAPVYIGGGTSGSTSGDIFMGNGTNRVLFVSNTIDTDDSSALIFEPPVTFNTNVTIESNLTVAGSFTSEVLVSDTLTALQLVGPIGTSIQSAGSFTSLSASENVTIGSDDTDTITTNSYFVTGTQLKSAKLDTNTLNLAAYDVNGITYTNLITLTAGNTPTLTLVSIGAMSISSTSVGNINNINIGASTRGTGAFTTVDANSTISDAIGNVRQVPQNVQAGAYALLATDAGKHISSSGDITVNTGLFSIGDTIVIYNNTAGSITIIQGASVTLRLVGTATTGTRTLAQRGLATILCVASNDFVVTGGGLT